MKMQNLATEDDVDPEMKRHISAYLNQKNRTLPCSHPATKDQCLEFAAAGQTCLHVQALAPHADMHSPNSLLLSFNLCK